MSFEIYDSVRVLECNTESRGVIRRHLSEGDEETVCTGTGEILELSASFRSEAW